MKHILMFVDNPARDDPRVMPEARSLVRAGYAVTIIGLALDAGEPTRDNIDGVNIRLAPMSALTLNPLAAFRGLARWLRGDPSTTTAGVPDRRVGGLSLLLVYLWVLRLALPLRADAVHSHDVVMLLPGWLYTRLRRVPLVYDAHENHALIAGVLRRRIFPRVERWLIGKADAVITVGKRLAAALRERGASCVLIIGNWKRLADYEVDPAEVQRLRAALKLDDARLTVAYIGTLAPTREIGTLLEAVAATPEVQLLIGGRGSEAEAAQAAAARTPRIHWLGWVDARDIPLYTHAADVVYCGLRSNETGQLYFAAPNKLFEAFAAGRALIANRGVGEMGELLERIPAAILLDGITVDNLKRAFAELQHPGVLEGLQAAALEARNDYNWSVGEARLEQLYAELLRQQP